MINSTLFKGTPVNIAGTFITAGKKAPKFSLSKQDLSTFGLSDANGKKLLLNIFPSLDTPVCAASVRKFNELAAQMPNTTVLCVSKDLPFAQSRFCVAEGIDNVITLSDFHYGSHFGEDYGVVMTNGPLSGLFARSIVLINEDGIVTYSAMTNDIVDDPDYNSVLRILSV